MTNNEIAVMRQALEALEHGLDYAKGEQFENAQRFKGYEHLAPDDTHSIQLIEAAVTSLRHALNSAQAIVRAESTLEAEKAQCDGGTCGLGGYCADCPKQKRDPLTDEQITALEYATDTLDFPQTVRAIEAAHGIKEKNSG